MGDENNQGSWDDDDFEPTPLFLTNNALFEKEAYRCEDKEEDWLIQSNEKEKRVKETPKRRTDRQYLYIIRHGDRWDLENPAWKRTASRPVDTPLSSLGHNQARETGLLLNRLFHEDGITAAEHITWISSPFLRCLQTSDDALNALTIPNAHKIRIKPEFSVSEWGENHMRQLPSLQERQMYFPRLDSTYETMFCPRSSEPPRVFWERCGRAASSIGALPYHPNTAIVVPTHAAVSIGLVEAAADLESWAGVNPAAPCGVYRLYRTSAGRGEKWIMDLNGHTSHMSCSDGSTRPYHPLEKKKKKANNKKQ